MKNLMGSFTHGLHDTSQDVYQESNNAVKNNKKNLGHAHLLCE